MSAESLDKVVTVHDHPLTCCPPPLFPEKVRKKTQIIRRVQETVVDVVKGVFTVVVDTVGAFWKTCHS